MRRRAQYKIFCVLVLYFLIPAILTAFNKIMSVLNIFNLAEPLLGV